MRDSGDIIRSSCAPPYPLPTAFDHQPHVGSRQRAAQVGKPWPSHHPRHEHELEGSLLQKFVTAPTGLHMAVSQSNAAGQAAAIESTALPIKPFRSRPWRRPRR